MLLQFWLNAEAEVRQTQQIQQNLSGQPVFTYMHAETLVRQVWVVVLK